MYTETPRAGVLVLYPENERDLTEITEMARMKMGRLEFRRVDDPRPRVSFVLWPSKEAE